MKLGEKIHILRKEKNMTMQILADKSNLTKGYISMLEKGKNPQTKKEIIPSLETVQNIALAFNMDLETFLKDTESEVELPKLKTTSTLTLITEKASQLDDDRQLNVLDYTKEQLDEQNNIIPFQLNEDYIDIQVYGGASAGKGQYVYDEPVETISVHTADIPNAPYDLALKVVGNSMEPAFEDGEYIFVKRSDEIHNGSFGIFIINGESYLKKVYVEDNNMRLVSLNKKYEDLIFNEHDDIKLIGKVVL